MDLPMLFHLEGCCDVAVHHFFLCSVEVFSIQGWICWMFFFAGVPYDQGL